MQNISWIKKIYILKRKRNRSYSNSYLAAPIRTPTSLLLFVHLPRCSYSNSWTLNSSLLHPNSRFSASSRTTIPMWSSDQELLPTVVASQPPQERRFQGDLQNKNSSQLSSLLSLLKNGDSQVNFRSFLNSGLMNVHVF